MFAIIQPYSLCSSIEENITSQCIASGEWTDGITQHYGCNQHPTQDKGYIEILPGYEEFFIPYQDQITLVDVLPDDFNINPINI